MTDAAKKVEKNLEDLEHSPGPYVEYLLKGGVPFGQTEPLIKTAVFLCPKTVRTASPPVKGGRMKRINSRMAGRTEVERK